MDTGKNRTMFPRQWRELGKAGMTEAIATGDTVFVARLVQPPEQTHYLQPIAIRFENTGTEQPGGEPELIVNALLGEGGMGRVHAAHQRSVGRDVAVKVPIAATPQARSALIEEGRLMGALEHPNIVPVHALGQDESGRPVLVMKRIEGVVWSELLSDPRHSAWPNVAPAGGDRLATHIEILMQVCNALHFAHSRGVVHCDLKPSNVMIGAFGEVYLLDWGIAARMDHSCAPRSSAALYGTPCFMPPELADADKQAQLDERTDVYLLGAALHFVLTGKPRHTGDTLFAVLKAAEKSQPFAYDASVPAELATLCNAATSRDPATRPATAAQFRQALANYLRHRGSIALSDSAQASLARVEALLARDPAARTGTEAGQLLVECRFGFAQALRDWSDNLPARRGLQSAVEHFIGREIDLRNADTARALLLELPEPRPDLSTRIDQLARELAEARAREAVIAREAREMDPLLAAKPRISTMVIVMCICVIGGIRAEIGMWRTGRFPPVQELLLVNSIILGAVAVVAVRRRKLFANRFNRSLWGWIMSIAVAGLLCNAAAAALNSSPLELAVYVALTQASGCAVATFTFAPGLWKTVAVHLGTASLILLVPRLAATLSVLGIGVAILLIMHEVRKRAAEVAQSYALWNERRSMD